MLRLRRLLAMAAAAGVLGVGLVACADDDPDELPPPPPGSPDPSPESTLPPLAQQAQDEVLALFDEFRELEIELYADPDATRARELLPTVAADNGTLIEVVDLGVDQLEGRGLVRVGRPTWEPTITEFTLEQQPPTVTIQDCLDATGWLLQDATTGEPVDARMDRFGMSGVTLRPVRQVVRFEARQLDEGWRLYSGTVEREEQC